MNSQRAQGGLWNAARPIISSDTQNLLKVMMQESKLTNFQQRTLSDNIKNGNSFPNRVAPNFTIVEKKKAPPKRENKIINPKTHSTTLRTYEEIVNSGAYEKSDYKPTIKKAITEKDKDRLAKIMAFGKDSEKMVFNNVEEDECDEPEPVEIDRFDELRNEINERAGFLEDMIKLGKRKQYETIIKTEISQKLREMELIDKQRTAELKQLTEAKINGGN